LTVSIGLFRHQTRGKAKEFNAVAKCGTKLVRVLYGNSPHVRKGETCSFAGIAR